MGSAETFIVSQLRGLLTPHRVETVTATVGSRSPPHSTLRRCLSGQYPDDDDGGGADSTCFNPNPNPNPTLALVVWGGHLRARPHDAVPALLFICLCVVVS